MKKFDQKKYQKDWRKKNMSQVSAGYKNEFVEKFKDALSYLNTTQSKVIRKAMEDTIMLAVEKKVNELLSEPTEEKLREFIEQYDNKTFAFRDFKKIAQEFVDEYSDLESMLYADDEKEMLQMFFDSNHRYDEKLLTMYGDDENSLTIYECDRYYVFTEWKDGMNDKDVYVLK